MSNQPSGGVKIGNGGHRQRIRFDRDDNEPPSVAVAAALAEFHGEDIHETTTLLYDYVDPEALDALFADRYDGSSRADGQIRFDVRGATVVVRSTSVEVY